MIFQQRDGVSISRQMPPNGMNKCQTNGSVYVHGNVSVRTLKSIKNLKFIQCTACVKRPQLCAEGSKPYHWLFLSFILHFFSILFFVYRSRPRVTRAIYFSFNSSSFNFCLFFFYLHFHFSSVYNKYIEVLNQGIKKTAHFFLPAAEQSSFNRFIKRKILILEYFILICFVPTSPKIDDQGILVL